MTLLITLNTSHIIHNDITSNINKGNIQGILKGEVFLYHWPPVWLVKNQLYDNWQFLFLFAK